MSEDRPSTRNRILQSAYALFYREGFARVSVDAIAERAGVTKRTIYYHFKSKDDIVADVLSYQHQYMMQQFQNWAGPATVGADRLVRNLFRQLKDWADGDDWLGSGFTRITTELADMPGHPARVAASKHKAGVEHWLSEQFDAAGLTDAHLLARQIMVLIEGSMSLALIHGDTTYMAAAGAAAEDLLRHDKS